MKKLKIPFLSYIKWILIGILFLFCQNVQGQKESGRIVIIIQLEQPLDSFSVTIAPLKYNKSFAFSFTLDDGLVCDYLVAYPFFNGGEVADSYIDQWGNDQGGDKLYYPGLYYSDGCGNSIPFKAGIAINAKNIDGADSIFHHGFLTWQQIKILYGAGWDVLNHSYSHETGKNINARYEVEKNNVEVKKHLGFEMKGFVIPGGHEDVFSNQLYTKTAFESGMETVQCEDFGNYMLNIDTIRTLKNLKLGRLFMHSIGDSVIWLRSGPNLSIRGTPSTLFSVIGNYLTQDCPFWINAFTHGVGNLNIWNISITFRGFISFFDQLNENYGQRAADNMWMAPTQEVYEYLLNRNSIKYEVKKIDHAITIYIDKTTIPKGLGHRELTFLLNGRCNIKSIRGFNCSIESYTKNKNKNIINVEMP